MEGWFTFQRYSYTPLGEQHTLAIKVAMGQVLKEILSLLYWTMLAACTVGPGTVVTCARAGAEFELNLIWALIFASVLAYTLQEGTARLTITSGQSLGQCLQAKYRHGRLFWGVGIICWVVAGSVFFGNTLYECNNWAGGMSAIYSLPGAENTVGLRVGCCIAYGVVVLAILFADKVDSLGIGLGIVMIGMVTLFLVVVVKLGLDGRRFAKGLLPISMPSGSANIVLSLIGTTSIGFNLFLGGKMAEGKSLGQAQRGIAFSTSMALIVSVLILIVGDGTYMQSKGQFTIASLSGIIERLTGAAGLWVFGIGFIAAALSSMLTVPLGAVMTAESVFSIPPDQHAESMHYSKPGAESAASKEEENIAITQSNSSMYPGRPFPKKYSQMLMVVMVSVAVVVISCDAPTVKVILIAQVFNGCLLPFFSICLLVCLNDPQFMKQSPQKGWSNCFMVFVVMVTLFLTANTIVQNIFGWVVTDGHSSESTFEIVKFSVSGVVSLTVMTSLCVFTSLGEHLKNSFVRED